MLSKTQAQNECHLFLSSYMGQFHAENEWQKYFRYHQNGQKTCEIFDNMRD